MLIYSYNFIEMSYAGAARADAFLARSRLPKACRRAGILANGSAARLRSSVQYGAKPARLRRFRYGTGPRHFPAQHAAIPEPRSLSKEMILIAGGGAATASLMALTLMKRLSCALSLSSDYRYDEAPHDNDDASI